MGGSLSAEDWDRRYSGAELVWAAAPNRFVAEVLDGVEPGRALDLAAGEGRNAVWLAQRGWQVTAVDFSAVAIEKGRALAAAHDVEVTWVCSDLAQWPPSLRSFDAVVLAYLHVPADLRDLVLAGAAAVLAPGGRLVVVGHHRDNLARGVGGPQDPELLHTPAVIVDALPDLDIECAAKVEREVATPAGLRTALDALVVARRPQPAATRNGLRS